MAFMNDGGAVGKANAEEMLWHFAIGLPNAHRGAFFAARALAPYVAICANNVGGITAWLLSNRNVPGL